jgi:Copper type II ascorbate-dependent monooxygenase, C-terminal domain
MKAALVALVILAACKADAPGDPVDANAGSDGADGPTADGWTPLIARSWKLAPGATNTYECTRIKVTNDMWVAGFRVTAPLGTHHAVLTISTTSTRTGDYDCFAGSLDTQMLYAAGVGTDDLLFPAGVAMHIAPGTYLNLNLHLFNATDNTLANSSGVLVKVVPQADVQHEADMMFSGTSIISIANDGLPHTAQGGCTAPSDWHIFTLWPHMHQTATHQKWTYTPVGGAPKALIDDDFLFNEQRNYPIADTLLHQGDKIETVCTYVNRTGGTIGWGDGSDKEMCYTGMYKYPAGGGLFQCTTGPHL